MHSQDLLSEIERDVVSGVSISDVLRKLIILGGRVGSPELRDWAARELNGYLGADDDLPAYRSVGAPILADAVTGMSVVKGQRIGPESIRDYVGDAIGETADLRDGIGRIEAMVLQAEASEKGAVDLSLPLSTQLAAMLDQASGNPHQHINALYWSVSVVSLRGIVDAVRTKLAGLVGELRAATPPGEVVPPPGAAAQAVNVVISGKARNVVVHTAQASGASSGANRSDVPEMNPGGKSPFWTRSRRIGAFIVGIATIVGTIATILSMD